MTRQPAAAKLRLDLLLEALLTVATGLELETALRHIVAAATGLTQARYGAIQVLGTATSTARFVDVGIDEKTRALMGTPPAGQGLLGQLTDDPRPLRLADVSTHPLSTGFPPHHPTMRSFLGVPVQVNGEVFGRMFLGEKKGGREFTHDDERTVRALAAAAGIAVQNADLVEEARRRQRRLEAAGEIANELLSGRTASHVLGVVAERTTDLLDADGAFILHTLPGETEVQLCAHAGLTDQHLAELTHEHVWLSAQGARLLCEPDNGEPAMGSLTGFGPAVGVPLRSGEKTVGAMVALRSTERPRFWPEELGLLTLLADQASIVLKVAAEQRAREQLDLVAIRHRQARELYDRVVQQLYATGMVLQGAVLRATDPDVQRYIQRGVDQLDDTMRDIRTSIFDPMAPLDGRP